ncbi:MAG: hypothetical protein JSV61_13795 [Anaerolineales bacterium]|nr:MAG: hypothetical protein JSV61_13795 [Anaerolineales bacterium]
MKASILARIFITLFVCLLLVNCQADDRAAAKVVENYFTALIAKDPQRLSTLSCSDWEASAQTDLESFGAVSAEIFDLSCDSTGEDGEYTLVTCKGKIVANYGDEILELNLSDQSYQTLYEGGEWRMCGYR